MKTRALLPALLWSLLGLGTVQAQVIVVNRSVKITEIGKSDLHDIFLGASSSFKDGSRAVPVTLKGGPVHEQFLKEYVGRSDMAFRSAWRQVVFAGQGTMPRAFDTEAALLEYIASTPGSVGYVGKAPTQENVKTLAVK
ncbi:MAG: hypothetical protein WDO73_35595 [Ignavibacteriota bacterium]